MSAHRANKKIGRSDIPPKDSAAVRKEALDSRSSPPSIASGGGGLLARGEVLSRALVDVPTRPSYLLYLPAKQVGLDRPLVLVHGQARGAKDLIEIFRSSAEQYGAMLIAPVFDRETSIGYQRLGLMSRRESGSRPDVRLGRILDDVTQLTGTSTERFHLFGHSGGAQFAHRYVMAHPDKVERYAISAAGWYTAPDPSVEFPYGMKAIAKIPSFAPDVEKFLGVPVCVLVGENDTLRSASLNKSARVDRTQGRTRVERANNWVTAMAAAARLRGLEPRVQLRVIPEVGHRIGELAARGQLGHIVSQYLFNEARSR